MAKQSRKTTGKTSKATAKRPTKKVAAAQVVGPQATQWFVVRGQVTTGGKPVAGLLVRAIDKDLRSEERLGEATTDKNGRYGDSLLK